LKDINVPISVKRFGSHAFSQTLWLDKQRERSKMVIVNNVLLDGALCEGNIVIPSDVVRVASWCFAGNTKITGVKIPSERIAIEPLSFRNCINLKKITDWNEREYTLERVEDPATAGYPELIQRIFSECVNCFKLDGSGNLMESTGNITELTFPPGIKSVGEYVYRDCHLLENIALADDTSQIGRSAFENSKWLKRVTNAYNVESIGPQAFSGCQSLESIELSDKLRTLGSRCFEHCSSLKEIYISRQLEIIPARAFFRCKSLTALTVPSSVLIIEDEAFAFCDHLEEVYISEKTQIAESAFEYCDRVRLHRFTDEYQ
nr:leucine-rich repeat domain-containing protein [Lachnospiraceae bacterium]